MKTLTIILACLLSSSVMAQKKDNGHKAKISGVKEWAALILDSANSSIYATKSSPLLFETGMFKPTTYTWMTEAKKAMEVTEKDKDGNIKVWIDPKRIVWTSDSTFTIKTK